MVKRSTGKKEKIEGILGLCPKCASAIIRILLAVADHRNYYRILEDYGKVLFVSNLPVE